jgi:DNA processing protein
MIDFVRMNLVTGMTPRAAAVLLHAFGSPGAVLRASPGAVRSLADVGPALGKRLACPPSVTEARAEIRRARKRDIEILFPGGEGYPLILHEIPDPPLVLYAKGRSNCDEEGVAIVGARRASVYGRVQAERFAREIARAGVNVISGLARGVDACAHRGALDVGGRTTAVLGSGLDRIYPPEHRRLAREIEEHGLLLSELPLGSKPLARHFPMRNRIIAGLSRAVLVVEGAVRSGSLITARLANECGRTVLAVPGRIDLDLGLGPNSLIRDGAVLVQAPEHVLQEVGVLPLAPDPDVRPPADPLQVRILDALDKTEPRGVEALLIALEEDAPPVLAALTVLELSRRVRPLPGGRYILMP